MKDISHYPQLKRFIDLKISKVRCRPGEEYLSCFIREGKIIIRTFMQDEILISYAMQQLAEKLDL